jgi:hypothetical protein
VFGAPPVPLATEADPPLPPVAVAAGLPTLARFAASPSSLPPSDEHAPAPANMMPIEANTILSRFL